jgi:hypothetical protein
VAESKQINELSLEELAETERLESELDQFVEKRARQSNEQRAVEEAWAETVRRAKEKKRSANGWGWIRHYEGLARAHRALALENDTKANHVRGLLGLPTPGDCLERQVASAAGGGDARAEPPNYRRRGGRGDT